MTDPTIALLVERIAEKFDERFADRFDRLEAALADHNPAPTPPPPPPLTVRDLAKRWSRTERSIRDLISAGRLRAIRVGRRGTRIPMAEVVRFESA